MAERCLMAASLAVLVFHPSSTIKCFKPKPTTTSPDKQRPSPSKPPHLHGKKLSSKSNGNQEIGNSNNGSSDPKDHTLFQSVSEVVDGESAMGIVQTIFLSGWTHQETVPVIKKVLRVHHTAEVLNRFEEYREMVKLKAAEICVSKRKERWVADGNEVLQYHGATSMCSLGYNGNSSICGSQICGVCSIIGSGCLARADWISFCESSWRAHQNMTESIGIMARRAMLVCRVIAGRVAYGHGRGLVEGEEGGFDSMVGPAEVQPNGLEELIVLDPRAVLPCFVIIYNVQ